MLVKRKFCPSCYQANFIEIYKTPYSDKGLKEFLSSYYTQAEPMAQEKALQDGIFTVLLCHNCGLYFQQDIPDDNFSAEIYGNWLGKNDPLAPHKPPMPMEYYSQMASEVMQIIAFLQKRNGSHRRLRFLDFGQGWGYWSLMARSFGIDVYGIELSPEKITYAKSIGLNIIQISDLENHQFDFINTEQVIEHLAEPRKTVDMLKKCLAPLGILKLSVPYGNDIISTLHSWDWTNSIARKDEIMPIHPLEHLNCFTSNSLNYMARSCGLKRINLPLKICYIYSTDWGNLKSIVKNILRPIKRFKLNRGCYALFTHSDLPSHEVKFKNTL